MVKFLLWCILLVLCWPLALLALVLYPIVWLLLLPFRFASHAHARVCYLSLQVLVQKSSTGLPNGAAIHP